MPAMYGSHNTVVNLPGDEKQAGTRSHASVKTGKQETL